MFQFTLPHGERQGAEHGELLGVAVSIHAPAWGATIVGFACAIEALFQFTLPHGERLPSRCCRRGSDLFQFTLPHGERRGFSSTAGFTTCFNSRSRMGSDVSGSSSSGCACSFNSRSRMGSDHGHRHLHYGPRAFQFTLPHGERRGFAGRPERRTSFNSRSRMGSDGMKLAFISGVTVFQFTLPHGERLVGDLRTADALIVSIHAPAWGATRIVP